MKRPWLHCTTKKSGNGWRVTYCDVDGPIVSVWNESAHVATQDARKHLEHYATPKEAGQ